MKYQSSSSGQSGERTLSKTLFRMLRLNRFRVGSLTQVAILFSLVLSLFAAPSASAQVTTGTILGKVADSSGAAVPNVSVVVTNEATGQIYSTTSGEDGSFLVPLLPITGTYSISAEVSGFKKFVQNAIPLRINENVRLDINLEIGEITQVVEVTNTPAQVDTRDSSLGEVVEQRRITELPLNGRNPIQLAALAAGVSTITTPPTYGFRGGEYLTVNGSRNNQNDYLLDGAHYNGGYINNGLTYPSPDALQEFKLITNTFSSEYGYNAGSIFNTVTKSGTNELHGSAWEFLRNDALNARNFFLNQPGAKKAKLRQNQFGFTLGGPIIKNRAFLFGAYEGLQIRQEALRTNATPTADERAGFFSTPLKDPDTGLPIAPDAQGRFFINPNRFNQITRSTMERFVPLPGPNGLLTQLASSPTKNHQFLVKGDADITSKNRAGLSAFIAHGNIIDPFFISSLQGYSEENTLSRSKLFTFSDTHTFGPTLINQLRLSYHSWREGLICSDQESLRDIGVASYIPDGPPNRPDFNVSGRFSLGTLGLCTLAEVTISRQIGDTVTWLHNNHSFKMGGEFIRLYVFTEAGFLNNGSFNFTGQFTGNALADFLVGRPANYSRQSYVSETRLTKHGAAFFQDDWKVSPRLTLNLGLRYQVQKPYVSVFLNNLFPDVKSTYRPGQQSERLPHAPRGLVYAGDPGIPRGLYDTDWTQFEPRLGLAWDIKGDGKTSLRLGYGLYHDIVYADTFAQSGGIPVLYSEFFNAPAGGVNDPYLGFPNPWPIAGDLNSPFATPTSFGSIPGDFKNPRVHQFTVDVQRQITRNLMVEAAYAGKLSKNLVINLQLNPAVYIPGTDAAGQPLSTPANIDQRRPLAPVFGSIRSIESLAEASYHSMQLTSRYRFNRGLSFTAAYTWSKSIDNMSQAGLAGAVPQDPFDPFKGNRGLSDYDVTNVFAASWVYELPTPFKNHGFLKALTSGWELTGITRLTSGFPFSVLSGVNNSLNGEGQDRADLIGNPHISGSRSRDEQINEWFNTAAFAVNPVGRVGNSGRNILRGPHQYNTDLGVMRNFSLGENIGKLQFRAEFFNAFNQVRFGLPNNVRSSPSFGRITSALNPRLVQFAIKFTR